jgi:hypothetical protein
MGVGLTSVHLVFIGYFNVFAMFFHKNLDQNASRGVEKSIQLNTRKYYNVLLNR